MFKFTKAERQLVRSIVANLTIKRIPDPEIIVGEIVENLESALEQFSEIEEILKVK